VREARRFFANLLFRFFFLKLVCALLAYRVRGRASERHRQVNKPRQHQGRALFLTYICGSYAAVLMAAPLLGSLGSASAGASRRPLPTFEQADRNRDGYVSRFESRAVRGLSESFERSDSNGDGKIDKVEYAKALAVLDANP
jgi:hypothetical protein